MWRPPADAKWRIQLPRCAIFSGRVDDATPAIHATRIIEDDFEQSERRGTQKKCKNVTLSSGAD